MYNGYTCAICQQWVPPGTTQHLCTAYTPQQPGTIQIPPCRAPWIPLTPDAIRLIVREELERVIQQLGKPAEHTK